MRGDVFLFFSFLLLVLYWLGLGFEKDLFEVVAMKLGSVVLCWGISVCWIWAEPV